MRVISLLLTLSLMLMACTPTPPQETQPTAPSASSTESAPVSTPVNTVPPANETSAVDSLAGTQWTLASYGQLGTEVVVTDTGSVTLVFSNDGQVTGSGGCNSFGGSYQVQGDTVTIGELVHTMMACVDTAIMDLEGQYLDALQKATDFQIEGDRLTLHYDDGQGVLNFVRGAGSPSEELPAATETPAPEAGTPITPAASSEVTTTAAGESRDFVWDCYSCGGGQAWRFEDGQANRLDLPDAVANFFGYSPATGQILYSTPSDATGGGPSQISVHDLWTLNLENGQSQALIPSLTVVEAVWAPDGMQLAYILATDTTYELHWRGPNGEDKLLAPDAAFTFSISRQGDKVAFTRESNYKVDGQPGLYVVDVATGVETKISDADRAGAGSIDDKPAWSPSGAYVLLPTYGTAGGPGLVRAMVDGSNSVSIQFDPSLSSESWYQVEPFRPFLVSDSQFIAAASLGGADAQLGGDATLILYHLNDARDTITAGAILGKGTLVGWDVPGVSVWVQNENGMESIALPK